MSFRFRNKVPKDPLKKSSNDDTYIKWIWDKGYLILNTRYYLHCMPKAEQRKLDAQMKSVRAKMTTIMDRFEVTECIRSNTR